MPMFEEITLQDSVRVEAGPAQVYTFLAGLVDDESYRAWHPGDHVALRWTRGRPWEEGSIVHAEEYLHGKLHKLRFEVTRVVAGREIHYAPLPRVLRLYYPGNSFTLEPEGDGCIFTATVRLRVGRLARALAGRRLEAGLTATRDHMAAEGRNLKKIVETGHL